MDNRLNKVFLSFSLFHLEFSPGNRLNDVFSNHFSFHSLNRKSDQDIKSYLLKLDNITLQALSDHHLVIVVTGTSIKNQVATFISHVNSHDRPVIKIIYHSVNATSTEVKLFVLRCSINQASYLLNINHIFVITNSLHATKRIFDLSSYLYQIQSAAISGKLREFFHKDSNNSIGFWDCLSNQNWSLHNIIDKETKKFVLIPILPCKSS